MSKKNVLSDTRDMHTLLWDLYMLNYGDGRCPSWDRYNRYCSSVTTFWDQDNNDTNTRDEGV